MQFVSACIWGPATNVLVTLIPSRVAYMLNFSFWGVNVLDSENIFLITDSTQRVCLSWKISEFSAEPPDEGTEILPKIRECFHLKQTLCVECAIRNIFFFIFSSCYPINCPQHQALHSPSLYMIHTGYRAAHTVCINYFQVIRDARSYYCVVNF